MAIELNAMAAWEQFQGVYSMPYFVDKSGIIKKMIPLMSTPNKYVCITRPRRFGKTIMAQMLASFFSKGFDSGKVFDNLIVSKEDFYREHRNQSNVIYIDFSEMPDECSCYSDYIDYIRSQLWEELTDRYGAAREKDALPSYLRRVFKETGDTFIFIMDEWDAIFQQSFITMEDKRSFLLFLKNLLKDKAYVKFAYMTGVLPIAKYSSGSELNMFWEFNMADSKEFNEYFGFTESEVGSLYQKYLAHCNQSKVAARVSKEALTEWYNGYHSSDGDNIYNPRSVNMALSRNEIGSYWTGTGPMDEVVHCIRNNVNAVREDIVRLVGGQAVELKNYMYTAETMSMDTRDEILSAMVVYGFLTCEDHKVSIPDYELMLQFEAALNRQEMGYVQRLALSSAKMLQATLKGDTKGMEEILSLAHDTEIPILRYNDEGDLASLVNLIYLAARDDYNVCREEDAGKGRADVLFYPKKNFSLPGIIIELKVDDTPENAIQQIKEKQYALRFKGHIAEEVPYRKDVLAVGMAYNSKTKEHKCKVEWLI